MKKILFSLFLGCALSNVSVAAEGDAQAGQAKSAMCSACHGVDGNSLVPMYPKLAGQHEKYIAKQLADFKKGAMSGGKEGRNDPVMAGMVMALTDQDMADLGAYFASQPISAGNGSASAAGQKLYFGGDEARGITACIACHGNNGKGVSSAGFPGVNAQNADYLKIQLEKFRSAARANDNSAMMRNIAAKLTDKDIAALSQFMASMK
jgi:cytochrome c553